MNDTQLKILNTLKQACSDPIVKQSSDARLQSHLADLGVLAAHLLTELIDTPAVRRQALKEFAAVAADAAEFLAQQGVNDAAAKRLVALAAEGDAAQFDAAMGLAHELQLELLLLANAEASALEKRLMQIEGDYGIRVLERLTARIDSSTGASPSAGQAKEFDPKKLSDFILRSFPDEKELRVDTIKFISGGSSKYTMAIRLTGARNLPDELILRGDSASSALFGGSSVVDEYRLLKIMYEHGVCVAKPLAIEETGDVFGSPFMLVERRAGGMIGHMFLMPPYNATTCHDVATKLAEIHRVPLSAIGDQIRGANITASAEVTKTLEESYKSWQALKRPSPLFESAFKWLRNNVAVMDRSRGIVHGDYGLHNLLVENDRVNAILDWEFAHVGNPVYDLGYFHYMAEALGSWPDFLAAYREAGGMEFSQEEIDYSILYSATRLGVMVCQGEAAYSAGITDGVYLALTYGRNAHNQSLSRIKALMDRLL